MAAGVRGLLGPAAAGGKPPARGHHAQRSADPGAESQALFSASSPALFMSQTKGLFIVAGAEKTPAKNERSVPRRPGLPGGVFPPPPRVFRAETFLSASDFQAIDSDGRAAGVGPGFVSSPARAACIRCFFPAARSNDRGSAAQARC